VVRLLILSIYVELCQNLGLDWQEIAYQEPETKPAQDYSSFSARLAITRFISQRSWGFLDNIELIRRWFAK
jgi:hypothetical protein